MTTLTIHLPDEEAERLRTVAQNRGTSPEKVAAEAVRMHLTSADTDFEAVVEHVVEKNAELYRRLA